MLSLENVDLELDGKPVLRSVSFDVERGDKVALFGESGSGKSSLLRVLIGQHRPRRGRVLFDGEGLSRQSLPGIRARMFYMPQEVRPIGEETAREFIDFAFSFAVSRDRRPDEARLLATLERFKLSSQLLDAKLSALSGGERQRIGLVRGLLLEREIMLLDEVTSAVDEENKRLIVEHLLELEHATIVAVTHDPLFIERASLRVELHAGAVASIGRP